MKVTLSHEDVCTAISDWLDHRYGNKFSHGNVEIKVGRQGNKERAYAIVEQTETRQTAPIARIDADPALTA